MPCDAPFWARRLDAALCVYHRVQGRAACRYIISKDGKRDGESIWEARDARGRLVVQDEIRNTMALPKGEVLVDAYQWQNPARVLRGRNSRP